MKNFFLFFLFCAFYTTQTIAQASAEGDNINDNIDEEIEIPESMTYEVDSLLNTWLAQNYITTDEECNASNFNPQFSDSVYIDRLSRIPSIMEMPYNDIVKRFIDLYTSKLRRNVSFMLGASNFYVPIFEEALDAYELPDELKYLPLIESALNPSAVSRAGASGLWQFMLGTGKIYGLESNSLIDERRDPIKSSWAAAKYLRDLYTIYQDWNLVIAAYNCGPGTINKAIRRANGAKDYWSIYPYLPRETKGYVPAFIAANYVMRYYCDHNICPMDFKLPANTDTIQVTKDLHFEQISDICGINVDQIRSLNPQYKRDVVPGHAKPCILRLPRNYVNTFIDSQDTIYTHRASELFNKRKIVAVKETSTRRTTSSSSNAGKAPSGKAINYKIKDGDTLITIAQQYKVTVDDLKRWNNIKGTMIWEGKTLKIYK